MQKSPCFHVSPASTTAEDLSLERQNVSRGILEVIYTPGAGCIKKVIKVNND